MSESLASIFSSKAQSDIKREIVMELLDSTQNLDEKTELNKPLRWACLQSMNDYIKLQELPESTKILKDFIAQSFKFLISKDRKGRGEYIEIVKALSKVEDEKSDKQNEFLQK